MYIVQWTFYVWQAPFTPPFVRCAFSCLLSNFFIAPHNLRLFFSSSVYDIFSMPPKSRNAIFFCSYYTNSAHACDIQNELFSLLKLAHKLFVLIYMEWTQEMGAKGLRAMYQFGCNVWRKWMVSLLCRKTHAKYFGPIMRRWKKRVDLYQKMGGNWPIQPIEKRWKKRRICGIFFLLFTHSCQTHCAFQTCATYLVYDKLRL